MNITHFRFALFNIKKNSSWIVHSLLLFSYRIAAEQAAGRAQVVSEFLQRKREAIMNKQKVRKPLWEVYELQRFIERCTSVQYLQCTLYILLEFSLPFLKSGHFQFQYHYILTDMDCKYYFLKWIHRSKFRLVLSRKMIFYGNFFR